MSDYIYSGGELYHAGKKGMKWGFNFGRKNGKRTAEEELAEHLRQQRLANMERRHGGTNQPAPTTTPNRATTTTVRSNKTQNTDKLFSKTTTTTEHAIVDRQRVTYHTTIKEIGKLEREMNKAKSWLNSLFKKPSKTSSADSASYKNKQKAMYKRIG